MNVVWVASMPRTASMWTMNVARSLLARRSLEVLPKDSIPIGEGEWFDLAAAAERCDRSDRVWVLKVHKTVRLAPSGAKFLVPYRDLRDAMASFQRFTRCDFETALSEARVWAGICEHYLAFPDDRRLLIDYDRVLDSPLEVVAEIAAFLDLELSPEDIGIVATEWRRDQVRSRTTPKGGSVGPKVGNFDGSSRAFDPATGFQEGHVSSGGGRGAWRATYSDAERRRIGEVLDEWLRHHGFME